jgi:hypothetical protein
VMVQSDLEAPITGASRQVRRAAGFRSRRTRVLRSAARGSGAVVRWGAWVTPAAVQEEECAGKTDCRAVGVPT